MFRCFPIVIKLFILFSVFGYKHRDASIEADLNKLYDTRPTASVSFVNKDHAQPPLKSRLEVNSGAAGSPGSSATETEETSSPYFDLNHSGDVTAVLGKTALLNCRVKNIGNKTVSLFLKLECKKKKLSRDFTFSNCGFCFYTF